VTVAVDGSVILALLAADALLTRDRGDYRSSFSGLHLLEP
jgi:hypothetical protein